MSIPSEAALQVALADAVEDYFGCYELVWDFNSRYPDEPPAARLNAAQQALRQLVRDGLAVVFRAVWGRDEYVAIDSAEADARLADPATWRSPAETPDGSYVCFTSTEAGDAAYARPAERRAPAS